MVCGWAISMLEPTLPVHLHAAFGAREAVIGLAFTELILSQQVFMPIIFFLMDGQAADRQTYMLASFIMLAAFLLLMFIAKSLLMAFTMLFFFAFAVALAMATCNTELADALGRDEKEVRNTGDLTSYYMKDAGYRVGTCFGPLVGAAFEGNSMRPFFITAIGCVVFLPLFFFARERQLMSGSQYTLFNFSVIPKTLSRYLATGYWY